MLLPLSCAHNPKIYSCFILIHFEGMMYEREIYKMLSAPNKNKHRFTDLLDVSQFIVLCWDLSFYDLVYKCVEISEKWHFYPPKCFYYWDILHTSSPLYVAYVEETLYRHTHLNSSTMMIHNIYQKTSLFVKRSGRI
jgi:hypothetical protein